MFRLCILDDVYETIPYTAKSIAFEATVVVYWFQGSVKARSNNQLWLHLRD